MFYFVYAQKYIKWQTMETSCHRQTCLFWLGMSGFITTADIILREMEQ